MSVEIDIFTERLGKFVLRVFLNSVGVGIGVDVFDSIVKK